jgi:hypothetical protein
MNYKLTRLFIPLCCVLLLPLTSDAETSWYPSQYGADDRIGALNNLSPAQVVNAAKLISTGKVYSLAIETNESSHDNYGRFYRVKSYPMTPSEIGPNNFTANESLIITNDGLGTTIDGFAHPGIKRRYYNGATEKEVLSGNLTAVRAIQYRYQAG